MFRNKNNENDDYYGQESYNTYDEADPNRYYNNQQTQTLYNNPNIDQQPSSHYANQDQFYNNRYKKNTYVELRKYVPTIFLIAICFILYVLGLAGRIIDLLLIIFFIAFVYSIVSIFVFKKSVQEVMSELKGVWTLSEGAFKRAARGFNDASQHIYDKYIVDDLQGDITRNNSYKGVHVDSYDSMNLDIAREKASGNISDQINPDYAKNVSLEHKDIYNQFKQNQYYESIENMDIESDYSNNKDNTLNYNPDEGLYKMDNQESNMDIDTHPEIHDVEMTKEVFVQDNEYLIIYDGNMVVNKKPDVNKYVTKNEKVVDIEVTPIIMSENLKLVNQDNELKVYFGDMKFRGNNETTIFNIEVGGKTYRIQCKNLEYVEVQGPMKIVIVY